MADEENENAPGAKKGSGSIIKFAVLGLVILVAMSGGFATWNFMLRPMLAPPMLDEVEAATTEEYGVPLESVYIELGNGFVNLLREGDDYPASLFTYKVSLESNNQATADFNNPRLTRFVHLTQELHTARRVPRWKGGYASNRAFNDRPSRCATTCCSRCRVIT